MSLPRLVYLADVPVEESFGGATLLYRLLEGYPADRLLVIETDVAPHSSGRRLPGVTGRRLAMAGQRVLRTRFRGTYAAGVLATAPWRVAAARRLAAEFRPEAVLSVAHGLSWATAHGLARRCGLPFHLVVHDDWRHAIPIGGRFRGLARHRFAAAYQDADERYCISSYMAEAYREEFGRSAVVLPPVRGSDCPTYKSPKDSPTDEPVYCYAGSLHNAGYRDLVYRLARLLPDGSRLLLFAPRPNTMPDDVRNRVEFRDPLPPRELIAAMRADADVLFCPSSFATEERHAMALNLPSKLADYTATGLPVFIWGPADSSPVKWASENPGAAVVVTDDDERCGREAVSRLRDVKTRHTLAVAAMRAGDRCFAPQLVHERFFEGLRRHPASAERRHKGGIDSDDHEGLPAAPLATSDLVTSEPRSGR